MTPPLPITVSAPDGAQRTHEAGDGEVDGERIAGLERHRAAVASLPHEVYNNQHRQMYVNTLTYMVKSRA